MKGKIKLNKTSTIYLAIPVLACLIALLLCACTSTGKNETTTINNITNQVAKKDYFDIRKTDGDQEIVCRTRIITGSTFKKKVCVTKSEWAKQDKIKKEKMEQFDRDMFSKTSLYDEKILGAFSGRMTITGAPPAPEPPTR
jgi:major membrane immunogen (membrane-anchored lipoprotein)